MRRAALAGAVAAAALLVSLSAPVAGGAGLAGPGGAFAGDEFTPELGLPATEVVAFGSSLGEAPGDAETWAYGRLGAAPVEVEGHDYNEQYALLERSEAMPDWQVVPLPELEGHALAQGSGRAGPAVYAALAGQVTQAGGVVLLSGANIVVRDPGTGSKPKLVQEPQPISSGGAPGSGEGKPGEGEGKPGEGEGKPGEGEGKPGEGEGKPGEGEGKPGEGEGKPGEGEGEGEGEPGRGASETEAEPGVLEPGESLLPPASGSLTVPYAAIEEAGGPTGVLIAPYQDGGKLGSEDTPEAQPGVLHYDGTGWTREPIEVEGEELEHFDALAIACSGTQGSPQSSSPENCWLLASYEASEGGRLALFRRVRSSEAPGWSWSAQPVEDWLLGSGARPAAVHSLSVAPLPQGAQMLTATAQGVWVDFEARINGQVGSLDESELVLRPGGEAAEKAESGGTWCYPTVAEVCEHSLGASLPAKYRSFAWPGAAAAEPGTRVITGLAEGAMLELEGGNFSYAAGPGGAAGDGGAALYRASPQQPVEGWIARGDGAEGGPDQEGQSQAIALNTHPEGDELQEEAAPFRSPLLAVAQKPGTTPGDPDAEALAVGANGEIARYVPGEGWLAEGLYNSANDVLTPTLSGVAWPEPKRAYAVGDEGEMWLYQEETGYWVPDPAKPFNFFGNLTAIAFAEDDPQLGYAVGKQGVLLKYNKSWEQISVAETAQLESELGVEESRLNFTSVAFAGDEALATYREVQEEDGVRIEVGGLLVNSGSGWHVDPSAASLLASLPSVKDTVLAKAAGLADGGAVVAGPDVVMSQESPGAPWRLSQAPLPEAQNIVALAAYREAGGPVRAIVSVELDSHWNPLDADVGLESSPYGGDVPAPTGAGQPAPFIERDPLPDNGYLLKETASGWSDMEHAALPVDPEATSLPVRPEPVYALIVEPSGDAGLAVGGQTYALDGEPEPEAETAAVMRFPTVTEQHLSAAPIAAPAGEASFAVGGEAECGGACYDLLNEQIGSEVWLTHALQSAGHIPGVRNFLYIGGWTDGAKLGRVPEVEAFKRELERFKELITVEGTKQVDVSANERLEPSVLGGTAQELFKQEVAPQGASFEPAGTTTAYALISEGVGGPVMLISLDFSSGTLGAGQEEWLESELQSAEVIKVPAIVMGYDKLGFELNQGGTVEGEAADAEAVSRILVNGKASAYLFEYSGVNVKAAVTYDGKSIPAYGTGTLGSGSTAIQNKAEPLHSSGFLVVNVDVAKRNPSTNVVPAEAITATVVPNVGRLSLDAAGGTLLRRSKVTLFEGLARRPPAGVTLGAAIGDENRQVQPQVYDPIPTVCQGPNCRYEVPIEYTFTSSKPDVGGFVVHEASSNEELEVQLNSKHKPIPDEPRTLNPNHELTANGRFEENANGEPLNENGEVVPRTVSGLFCAYNEGTTEVKITTGGLSYTMPITVRGGSSEYPCGTVPLKNPPPLYEESTTPIALPNLTPQPTPAPVQPHIQSVVPPPVPKLAAKPAPKHKPAPKQVRPQPATPILPVQLFPIPVLVPPPAPSLAQPTPPSGTAQVPAQSPVSQQVGASEREEELEGATEHVQNMAAYDDRESNQLPTWPIALVVLAAVAAAGMRPRRRREEPVYAWARRRR